MNKEFLLGKIYLSTNLLVVKKKAINKSIMFKLWWSVTDKEDYKTSNKPVLVRIITKFTVLIVTQE